MEILLTMMDAPVLAGFKIYGPAMGSLLSVSGR